MDAQAQSLAQTELLKLQLATGVREAPIRLVFLTREAVRAALLRDSPDAQVDAAVGLACSRAVPIVAEVIKALGDVIDPNVDALRAVIGEILQRRCAEAIRAMRAHPQRSSPADCCLLYTSPSPRDS